MLTEEGKKWRQDRLDKIESYLNKETRQDFIDDNYIEKLISQPSKIDKNYIQTLIQKTKELKGLTPEETAYLLNIEDENIWEELFQTARFVKNEVYGNRIVLFAPLYLSNYCVNNCLYCGFRESNKDMTYKRLNDKEIELEIQTLTKMGHKRLIVVYGEDPSSDIHYMEHSIKKIYDTKNGHDFIRRVNVNAAPLFVDEYKVLKDIGIGTYQVFQETYHKETYKKLHPQNTIKGNYLWRLFSLHRAQDAGIDDVAIGALFGLYKWKFEVLALLYHAMDLEKEFGVGSHTISFPRLEPALGTPYIQKTQHKVSDADFKKIVAILRLAVPYTGLILTAREQPELRREVIKLGVSQTDAGTRVAIGGYHLSEQEHIPEKEQFQIGDTRSVDEYIYELISDGFIPSFCTAGYRCGRTGCEFMSFARNGQVKKFCVPNAILTFKEYLLDYASQKTITKGEEIIQDYITFVRQNYSEKTADIIQKYLKRMENGERDIYF